MTAAPKSIASPKRTEHFVKFSSASVNIRIIYGDRPMWDPLPMGRTRRLGSSAPYMKQRQTPMLSLKGNLTETVPFAEATALGLIRLSITARDTATAAMFFN